MTLTRRQHWLLFLAISFTTVLGAPTAPPTCARTCFDSTSNNIPRGSCTASDTACLCSSNPYSLQVRQCIVLSCLNATDRGFALIDFADACNEAITAVTTTITTSIPNFISSTQSLSTNALTDRSNSPTHTTATTSTRSPTASGTTTETPIPPVILPTTGSPAPSTNASPNAVTENSTDQGNVQQRNAITGSVVGVATLIAIFALLLVVYRRRKNKKRVREALQHSQFIGEEVGSPSAAVRPWRITILPFTSITHPNTGGYQAKETAVIGEPPRYEGPGPIQPEKYTRGEIPLANPRQPGPLYQQQFSHPADEYHDIGSNFLRG